MAKSSCFSLNNWMLLVGCEENFCKADSWQHLGCSCKHRQGRTGSLAPVSSTFAPGEHLKEMASIAQGLWWGLKGMLQTVKENALVSQDHLLLCKRRDTWKPDGTGPVLGLLWAAYSRWISLWGRRGWTKQKCCRQNSLLFSITLEDWSVHKCLSGEAKLITKAGSWGPVPVQSCVNSSRWSLMTRAGLLGTVLTVADLPVGFQNPPPRRMTYI